MHACLTPPPSSIGQLSPTHQDEESCRLWPSGVQAPDRDSPCLGGGRCRRGMPVRLGATSKRLKGRRPLSPSSDVTNDSSEDELHALPGLPPSKNMSYYVQRAKSRFKPYDRRHGHGPNAIELRFFHKSVGKCSGETDMALADVQAGKELFERGLQGMSGKVAAQAVVAMQATRESKRLRVLTTAWEIESSVQRTKLLEMMLEQDALEFVRSDAEASYFKKLLVGRTSKDLNVDIDFNIGAYSCDVTSFVVADVQLDHIEGLARSLCQPEEDDDDSMEGESPDSKFDVHT